MNNRIVALIKALYTKPAVISCSGAVGLQTCVVHKFCCVAPLAPLDIHQQLFAHLIMFYRGCLIV